MLGSLRALGQNGMAEARSCWSGPHSLLPREERRLEKGAVRLACTALRQVRQDRLGSALGGHMSLPVPLPPEIKSTGSKCRRPAFKSKLYIDYWLCYLGPGTCPLWSSAFSSIMGIIRTSPEGCAHKAPAAVRAHSRCSIIRTHSFQRSDSDSGVGRGQCPSWSHSYLPTVQNPSIQLLFL